MGRIYRIGQQEPQLIWIVVGNHTYEQALQYRAAEIMVAQIAGQGNIELTDDEFRCERLFKDSLRESKYGIITCVDYNGR